MQLLAEGVDRQAFDDLVLAAFAGDRVAEHHVLRDAVFAVARHAHRDPFAVGAQRPVAHVVDGGVGGRGRRRQAARLDDGGAALADGGQEHVPVPDLVVDHVLDAAPSMVAKR
jgi:hypothetical protein